MASPFGNGLHALLQGVRISQRAQRLIVQKWGDEAAHIIRQNPYQLAEAFEGVGFQSADTIARRLGFPLDHKLRIRHGIIHTLKEVTFSRGHLCLPRNQLVSESGRMLGLYDKEFAVDGEIQYMHQDDVIAFGDEFVYLKHLFRDEIFIAEKLLALLNTSPRIAIEPNTADLMADQISAINKICHHPVFILTGAPGTGKTFTIKRIIESFRGARIAMAAPTGKAAKRMIEQTGCPAQTIHKLLEAYLDEEQGRFTFARDADNPIEADVIILDEVSMLDNALMADFLLAVEDGTRLIFVGDTYQLPSVGPGNILKDMIGSGAIPCEELTIIKRQDPGLIITNCHKIKSGENIMLNPKDPNGDFFFIRKEEESEILAEVVNLVKNRLPAYYKVDPMADIQVLSPFREKTGLSCEAINDALQRELNPRGPVDGVRKFKVGDKVIQTKNDYQLEIINGDMGYILDICKDTLGDRVVQVRFENPERIVEIPYKDHRLQLAYGITCHRFQGSEQKIVVIPIHSNMGSFVQRNWLYTAISRASKVCVLVGHLQEIPQIIKRNHQMKRYTRLASLLAGGAECPQNGMPQEKRSSSD